MTILIFGLVIFLGIHSIRIVAESGRQTLIGSMGEKGYKGMYTVLSLMGFALIIYGYGQARLGPSMVWNPPSSMRLIAALLTLLTFILLAASYIPGNRIKRAVGHPMVLGVLIWAFAHLLANGMLADVVLFGSFLVWAALDYRAALVRDRVADRVSAPAGSLLKDALTLASGLALWVVFVVWLHQWLIGVKPFG